MKKFISIAILFLIIAAGCINCSAADEPPVRYAFDWHDFFKVDGSTTTEPMTLSLAIDLVGVENGLFDEYQSPRIKHNKTHQAFMNLVNGTADIIFITYPSEDELEYAQSMGVELESYPVANDAFVFLGNIDNPVVGLTTEQVQNIYTGEINNWSEVGGSNSDIFRIYRNENSGSQSEMLRFMNGKPIKSIEMDFFAMEMGRVVDSITSHQNAVDAIGYSYYFYVNQQYVSDSVKCFALDGVLPSSETIRSGEYPEVIQYYAIIRKDTPEGSFPRMLLLYLLSDDGQRSIEEIGYVGL